MYLLCFPEPYVIIPERPFFICFLSLAIDFSFLILIESNSTNKLVFLPTASGLATNIPSS